MGLFSWLGAMMGNAAGTLDNENWDCDESFIYHLVRRAVDCEYVPRFDEIGNKQNYTRTGSQDPNEFDLNLFLSKLDEEIKFAQNKLMISPNAKYFGSITYRQFWKIVDQLNDR